MALLQVPVGVRLPSGRASRPSPHDGGRDGTPSQAVSRWRRVLPLLRNRPRPRFTKYPQPQTELHNRARQNGVLKEGLHWLNKAAWHKHRLHLRRHHQMSAPTRAQQLVQKIVRAWTHPLTPLQRFRRIAGIVRMLCSVCINLRKYAMEAGFLENYMVTVTTRKTRINGAGGKLEELSFNLRDYKARKELTVPFSVIRLLNKRPEDRTDADLEVICHMMRSLPSFRKYTHHMQRMFCKIVRYMKCGKRRVVLRKGHVGYCLYFVYTGAVSVVLDKDDGNVFVKAEVIVLKRGACFGEIALIAETKRNATVVCAEDTEFLYIDKEDFLINRLDRQLQEEFNQRYSFFRNWSPLADWTDADIKELSYVSRSEEVGYNKLVVSDSTRNEWLWFIVKGSCDLMRMLDLESCDAYQGARLGRAADQFVTRRSKGEEKPPPVKPRSVSAQIGHKNKPRMLRPRTSPGVLKATEPPGEDSMIHNKPYTLMSETSDSSDAESDISATKDAHVTVVHPSQDQQQGSNPDVGTGICIKLDTLRDGQCFGINENKLTRLSLLSKGCELIQVPRAKFMEMADHMVLADIREMDKTYPADNDLCRMFLDKNNWNNYKQEVVAEVVSTQRHCFQQDSVFRTVSRPNSHWYQGNDFSKMPPLTTGGKSHADSRGSSSHPGYQYSYNSSPPVKEHTRTARLRPRTCPAGATRGSPRRRNSKSPSGRPGSRMLDLSPPVSPGYRTRSPRSPGSSRVRNSHSPRTSLAPPRTSPVPLRTSPVPHRTSPVPPRTSPVPAGTSSIPPTPVNHCTLSEDALNSSNNNTSSSQQVTATEERPAAKLAPRPVCKVDKSSVKRRTESDPSGVNQHQPIPLIHVT